MNIPDYENPLAAGAYNLRRRRGRPRLLRTARQLGISYVFVGRDRRTSPTRDEALAKFDRQTGPLSGACFRTHGTRIYEIVSALFFFFFFLKKKDVVVIFAVACLFLFPSSPSGPHRCRNHRRTLGAGLHSALRSCDCARLASWAGRCSGSTHLPRGLPEPLGYALTCLALWAVLAAPSVSGDLRCWRGLSPRSRHCWRSHLGKTSSGRPCLELPAWSPREARILVLLLLIVPAVFLFPYKNLGSFDAEGNRLYRAYFTADFIWHTALTAELAKYQMPPVNPYLGDRTIQYYWTYFLVPAVIAQEGPGNLADIESSLKVNALLSGVLFLERSSRQRGRRRSQRWVRLSRLLLPSSPQAQKASTRYGICFPRQISRGAHGPKHRCHERMGVQRAACRQPGSIDVAQPSAFDVCRAGPPRDAGGGSWRVSQHPSAASPWLGWRWRFRRRSIRSSEGCFRSSTAL